MQRKTKRRLRLALLSAGSLIALAMVCAPRPGALPKPAPVAFDLAYSPGVGGEGVLQIEAGEPCYVVVVLGSATGPFDWRFEPYVWPGPSTVRAMGPGSASLALPIDASMVPPGGGWALVWASRHPAGLPTGPALTPLLHQLDPHGFDASSDEPILLDTGGPGHSVTVRAIRIRFR